MHWILKCLVLVTLVIHGNTTLQQDTYKRLKRNEQPASMITRPGREAADFSRRNGIISFDPGQETYNFPSGYDYNLNPEVSYQINSRDILNDVSEQLALQNKQSSNYDSDIAKFLALNYRKKVADPVKKIPFISKIQNNILHEPVPISQHIEVSQPIPIPSYTHVPVGVSKPYQISIPYPVLVPVPQPYPVEIPVNKPVAVPYVEEIKIPIEKIVLYPVVKNVPYPVTKNIPYPIEKQITVQIPQPYPVEIPVLKTVLHKSKGNNEYETESSDHKWRKSDVEADTYYDGDEEDDRTNDESDYQTNTQKQNEEKSKNFAKDRYPYRGNAEKKENNRHSNQDNRSSLHNKGYEKYPKYNSYRRYT